MSFFGGRYMGMAGFSRHFLLFYGDFLPHKALMDGKKCYFRSKKETSCLADMAFAAVRVSGTKRCAPRGFWTRAPGRAFRQVQER
ncbi:MAG: hypothetical protein Q4A06_06825 [Cardiobacteriaceae bacterium]|nr:hypothetical protein [Cardiobacteriaceae bacterium]